MKKNLQILITLIICFCGTQGFTQTFKVQKVSCIKEQLLQNRRQFLHDAGVKRPGIYRGITGTPHSPDAFLTNPDKMTDFNKDPKDKSIHYLKERFQNGSVERQVFPFHGNRPHILRSPAVPDRPEQNNGTETNKGITSMQAKTACLHSAGIPLKAAHNAKRIQGMLYRSSLAGSEKRINNRSWLLPGNNEKTAHIQQQLRTEDYPARKIMQVAQKSFLQSTAKDSIMLDSIFAYSFSSLTDSMLGVKWYVIYNNSGKELSEVLKVFDTVTFQWILQYKYDFFYDRYGNDTLEVEYERYPSGNELIPSNKWEFAYDNDGNIIKETGYSWDEDTKRWTPGSKDEYAYDQHANCTSFAWYIWDMDAGQWIGQYKYEDVYDDKGNQVMHSDFYWNQDLNEWGSSYKQEYDYDSNGNQIMAAMYNWDENADQWIGEIKYEYSYDEKNNQTESVNYNWDGTGNEWIGSFKDEFAYDERGNQTLYVHYFWDEMQQAWKGSEKYEFAYDDRGNQTMYASYSWSSVGNTWTGNEKYESAFNDQGIEIMYAYYTYTNHWIGINKNEYEETNMNNGIQILSADYEWDNAGNRWKGNSKNIYFTDFDYRIIGEIAYKWDNSSAIWVEDTKSEYYYSNNSLADKIITSHWNGKSNEWILFQRDELAYDQSGNLLSEESDLWNTSTNAWEISSKVQYSYNESGLLTESITEVTQDTVVPVISINGFNEEKDISTGLNNPTCHGQTCITLDDDCVEGAASARWDYQTVGYQGGALALIELNNSQDLSGGDGICLFYKNAGPNEIRFVVIFTESGGETWTYNANGFADTLNTWQQLVIPFSAFQNDAYGNGVFDLSHIISIQFRLSIPRVISSTGTLFIDGLSVFNYERSDKQIVQSKERKAYNAEGSLISDTLYQWNSFLEGLFPVSYTKIRYDENLHAVSNESYHRENYFDNWTGDYKEEYTYDVSGNPTQYVSFTWNSGSAGWIGSYKYEITNDESGYPTSLIIYIYDPISMNWIVYGKEEYSFNEQGQETSYTSYFWATESFGWLGLYKEEYWYDDQGNQNGYAYYSWDEISGSWVGNYKEEFAFDNQGNETLLADYHWGISPADWIGDYKYEYSYDEQGNQTSFAYYSWDIESMDWTGMYKEDYGYDEQGNQIGYISYNWNYELKGWEFGWKEETTYDQWGNTTGYAYYYWDSDLVAWYGNWKYETVYNLFGDMIKQIYYEWDYENAAWIISDVYYYNQWEDFYNENGQIILEVIKQWDETSGLWRPVEKHYYFYSNHIITSTPVTSLAEQSTFAEIYPNPAHGSVNIKLSSNGNGCATLYDNTGRLVKSVSLKSSLNTIPLNGLNEGMYIFRIQSGEKVSTKKLIIN